jgi:hypothetical protein
MNDWSIQLCVEGDLFQPIGNSNKFHDQTPLSFDTLTFYIFFFAIIPASCQSLLIDTYRLENDNLLHSLLNGQLIMNIPLEKPNERITSTIKEVSFNYKIRIIIFPAETKTG